MIIFYALYGLTCVTCTFISQASHAKDNYDETQSVMSDDGTLSTLSVDSSEHSVEEEDASTKIRTTSPS